MSRTYRDLLVWQKAKGLVVDVYQITGQFPRSEQFGLTAQIRRAAVSIPSNIAEGQGRATKGEFLHFLGIARGSLLEVETQLQIAVDLGYMSVSEFEKCDARSYAVLGLLNRLMASLTNSGKTEHLKPSKP